MSIKMIVVDMDGTFLDDRMGFDRRRFGLQYAALKARGIKFVVASGNQYYQLTSFFPQIAGDTAFVAENGAYIVDRGQDVFCGRIDGDHYNKVINTLAEIPYLDVIVCAKNSAYLQESAGPVFYRQMNKYYHRLAWVADFSGISDQVFKFALTLPDEKLPEFMAFIATALADLITPVSSGHGSVDLILPGRHKANGLRILQKQWGIKDHEVVAFGDGGNDIEMLRQAGFGYAMANAPKKIKDAARYETTANNDSGVLRIIDKILASAPPFA